MLAIRRSKALVIGRIQGKAVGGGVGLIASCDYCYATETASIKLSEIGIGIAPLVIEPAVSRKIGVGALAEFTLNPNEWKNLADVPEFQSHKQRLLEVMHSFQNDIGDPFASTENLQTFIREQKEYQSKPYKRQGFRWPHLDLFEHSQARKHPSSL